MAKYELGTGTPIPAIACKYNSGVNCSSWTTETTAVKCEKCGWRKEVSETRLIGIRLKRKIQMVKPLDVYSAGEDESGNPIILKNGQFYMTARSKDLAESISEMLNKDVARTD